MSHRDVVYKSPVSLSSGEDKPGLHFAFIKPSFGGAFKKCCGSLRKCVAGSNAHLLGLSFICLKNKNLFFITSSCKRPNLLLTAAFQGTESQQLVQKDTGDR